MALPICVFYFSLSETQLKNQGETIVKNNLNSIVYKIQDNKIIDNAWLSQLEAGNKIIVHIEDGKYPLSFRGSPIEKNHRQQMEFVASASHELRSPVTVMGLSIASLEKSRNEEDTNKFISSLKHECIRMSRLVNDLLTLAGSDINAVPLNSEKIDVQTLLLSLYEHYTSLAFSNSLKLTINLPDCPIPVLNGIIRDCIRLWVLYLTMRCFIRLPAEMWNWGIIRAEKNLQYMFQIQEQE